MSSMEELIQNFMITTQGPQMPAGEVYFEAENPNVRGALSVGFIETLPETELNELGSKIDAGEVDTIVVYNEDLTVAGISSEQLAKVKVVYFGTHSHSTAEAAQVVIPTLSVFEKQGTFINQKFRLQKFLETAPGPTGVADDLESLSQLLNHVEHDTGALGSVNKIWSELSKEVSMFNDLSFGTLSPEGFLLDGSAFTHLKFCEGKTLHYSPAAETVEAET